MHTRARTHSQTHTHTYNTYITLTDNLVTSGTVEEGRTQASNPRLTKRLCKGLTARPHSRQCERAVGRGTIIGGAGKGEAPPRNQRVPVPGVGATDSPFQRGEDSVASGTCKKRNSMQEGSREGHTQQGRDALLDRPLTCREGGASTVGSPTAVLARKGSTVGSPTYLQGRKGGRL